MFVLLLMPAVCSVFFCTRFSWSTVLTSVNVLSFLLFFLLFFLPFSTCSTQRLESGDTDGIRFGETDLFVVCLFGCLVGRFFVGLLAVFLGVCVFPSLSGFGENQFVVWLIGWSFFCGFVGCFSLCVFSILYLIWRFQPLCSPLEEVGAIMHMSSA